MRRVEKEKWICKNNTIAVVVHFWDGTCSLMVAEYCDEWHAIEASSLIPFPHHYTRFKDYKYAQSARRWIANNL